MSSQQTKLQATAVAYSGELKVDDGAFDLHADQFIVRDGEVAFRLSGVDGDGEFMVEGVAKLTSSGKYVSNMLKVNYTSFASKDDATIQFDVIKPTAKKLRCYVEGKWLRGVATWTFSGNLRPYKSKIAHASCNRSKGK